MPKHISKRVGQSRFSFPLPANINVKFYLNKKPELLELLLYQTEMSLYQIMLYQGFHSPGTHKPAVVYFPQDSNHTTSQDYGVALEK